MELVDSHAQILVIQTLVKIQGDVKRSEMGHIFATAPLLVTLELIAN